MLFGMGTASQLEDLRIEDDADASPHERIASGVHAAVRVGAVPPAAAVPREAVVFREKALAEAEAVAHAEAASAAANPPALPKPNIPLQAVPTAPEATEPDRTSRTTLAPSIATFSRFELLGRLAVGGMAEIFLARESVAQDLTRNLVVKILRKPASGKESDGHFERLFLREGRVAAQLMHPNICHVYEFGRHRGHYFIAMEYVEGASLRDLLAKIPGNRLDPLLAAWLFGQIATALHYAHTASDARRRPLGVVHRDVSPQNIMVRNDGIVKLVDFGVAQVGAIEDRDSPDMLFGKLAYMAPEQCRAESKIDGRADVFALGICLYEALTGRRLYRRKDAVETVRALLEEPLPSMKSMDPTLPDGLCRIVLRALSKKREQRYANADEMRQALDRFVARSGRTIGATDAARLMSKTFSHELACGPLLTTELDLSELTSPAPETLLDGSSLDTPAISEGPRPTPTLSLRAAILLAGVAAAAAWMASRGSVPTEPAVEVPKAAANQAAPEPIDAVEQQPKAAVPAEQALPEGTNEGSAQRETRTLPRPGFIKNAGF